MVTTMPIGMVAVRTHQSRLSCAWSTATDRLLADECDARCRFDGGRAVAKKYQLGTAAVLGDEAVVVGVGGEIYPLGALDLDPSPPASLAQIIGDWTTWGPRLGEAVDRLESPGSHPRPIAPGDIRWLPPILYPRKLICLGDNDADHGDEMATAAPKLPYAFLKAPTTTLAGAGSEVTLNRHARMNDREVELAVVVGRRAKDVPEDAALGHVAGYAVLNEVSARDWIEERPEKLGIDWVMRKSPDGYAPMGAMITPAEFVPDPQSLDLQLAVNGQIVQRSNTSKLVFTVRQIIAHLS